MFRNARGASLGRVRDARSIEPIRAAETTDRLLVDMADRQEGVVGRQQLLALGLTRHQINGRLASGLLVERYRGVYSVGRRRLTRSGRWMAAVLASGEGAVLSHRSAAALFGLRVSEKTIEVTAPNKRIREGVVVHRAVLAPDEITTRDGVPTTTAARTLLDLAAVETPFTVERALHEAERLQLADTTPLAALLARYPRRPGTPALKRILAALDVGFAITRSELEDRFLAFLDDAGLPRPRMNTLVEGFEVDCVWPEARLIVELDGHAFHATRRSFEADRARDRALQLAGYRVIRITYRELHTNHAALAADLLTLLTSSSHPDLAHPAA